MRLNHTTTHCPVAQQGDLHEHLIGGVAEGQYDRRVVDLLASASAWAYSEIGTYTDVLCRRGLEGETVEITVKDTAMSVDTTVYVFQSTDKKLGIISFRTGHPATVLTLMTDTNARKEPFIGEGYVHGVLATNIMAVGVLLKEFMAALYLGESIGKRLTELQPKEPGKRPNSDVDKIGKEKAKLQALYISGHGMGGALAEMTAACVYMDPKFEPMRPLLKATNSYGAPRWADPSLAMSLHQKMGMKTYRFEYQYDVVTRLPARPFGRYLHFGRRYVSSGRNGVWVQEVRLDRLVLTRLAADYMGTIAFVKDRVLGGRIFLPALWADHSPMNYVKVAKNSNPDMQP
jgi:hypothetical protein